MIHDMIVANIAAALGEAALDAGPDVSVYRAGRRLVAEVLSDADWGVAWDRKLRDYRKVETVEYLLLVDSEVVGVTLYERGSDGWNDIDLDRLADVVELPAIGCRLTLAEIYEETGLSELFQDEPST